MALISRKPTSAGRRFQTATDFAEITRSEPEKSLVRPLKKTGGRNSYGRVTAATGVGDTSGATGSSISSATSWRFRPRWPPSNTTPTARRALRCSIMWTARSATSWRPRICGWGTWWSPAPTADIKPGNTLPLPNIPTGTLVHNVEMKPGKGGQMARAAGSSAQLMAKEGKQAHLKLPSGEVRMVPVDCRATIGQLSNVEQENVSLGKAGRKRWVGKRPHVRGVAMNPVDHPMGGGEGKSSGGRHPCTPWGVPTKGYKTRKPKASDRYIVKHRSKK